MPLVMCVFTLKVSTHITNGTVIINNMHCMYKLQKKHFIKMQKHVGLASTKKQPNKKGLT